VKYTERIIIGVATDATLNHLADCAEEPCMQESLDFGEKRWADKGGRSPIVPIAIFIIGILLTVLATGAIESRESNRTAEAFSRTARTRSEAVEARVREFTLKLQSLSAFVAADEEDVPAPLEWERFLASAEIADLAEVPMVAMVESVPADSLIDFRAEHAIVEASSGLSEAGQPPPGTAETAETAEAGETGETGERLFVTRLHGGGADLTASSSLPRAVEVTALAIADELDLDEAEPGVPEFFPLDSELFDGADVISGSDFPTTGATTQLGVAIPTFDSEAEFGDPEASRRRGWVVAAVDPALILVEEAADSPFRVQLSLFTSPYDIDDASVWRVASYSPDGLTLADAGHVYAGEALIGQNFWRIQTYASPNFSAPGFEMSPLALILGLVSTLMVTLGATFRWRAARRTNAMRELVDQTNVAARTDELTGLTNRVGLIEALVAAISDVSEQRPLAALFMDLNRFKNINDTLGHGAGDDLLRTVARQLETRTRPGETLARFGGDEFVLVSPRLSNEHEAEQIALRMLEGLDGTFELASGATKVSMAVGIATTTTASEYSAESLLRDADLAMYRAKRRNERVGLFDASMRTDAVQRLEIERQLQLGFDDLRVVYQPIVDVADGRVSTVEALVRWDRPGVGLVSPGEFLDVVSEAGMLDELGMFVLIQAATEVAQRNRDADPGEETGLAVNVVLSQLLDVEFLHEVAYVLEETGLRPQQLTLELSEDIAFEHLEDITRILRPLSRLGIKLSIDDFGTGNTSLAHLTRLNQISELKIDGSFISDLTTDMASEALVRGMMTIAQRLDLGVIAEGVESVEVLYACIELGIPSIQGYLLARPTELAGIPKWIAIPERVSEPDLASSIGR